MTLLFPKKEKSRYKEISTPANYVTHIAGGLKLPPKAIICPISSLTKYVTSHHKYKQYRCEADIYVLEGKNICYVTNFGYGSPTMAMTLEVLIALGVKEAVFIGLAGSLQEEVQPSDIVLCNEALCEDGTSPCYTAKETVKPSALFLKNLQKSLQARRQNFHIGRNWSTDAIFRETQPAIKHYQKHTVLTVEMETAAFYAVSQRRKIKAVAAYSISDKLCKYRWETHFGEKPIYRTLEVIFESAKEILK